MNTKISDEIKFMSGMSGKKYRYLINNLISFTSNARYLEIGCWAGSTVCSALYGNQAKAVCIDNWLKFDTEEKVRTSAIIQVFNECCDELIGIFNRISDAGNGI